MKKGVKMIVAGATIFVIGLLIFIIFCGLNGWNFNPDYEMMTFESEEKITRLNVYLNAGSVETVYTDEDKITVTYPENENFTAECKVENGVLKVSNGKRYWYNFTWWFGKIPTITITIPKGTVYDLDLYINAGYVNLAKNDYGKVNIKLNAGTLNMGEASCSNFNCELNAGSVSVTSLSTEKAFVKLNAGGFSAGKLVCPDIETKINAGSVSLDILGVKSEYSIFVDKNAGSCNLSNAKGTTDKEIRAKVNAGSLDISFTN